MFDVAADVGEFELDEVAAEVTTALPFASKGALAGVNCARSVFAHAMGMAHW